MTDAEVAKATCRHTRIDLEHDPLSYDDAFAECRDCGQVADVWLIFDEWMDYDEYDQRLVAGVRS